MASKMKHYALLITAMFFWGGSWVSAKILVQIAPAMTIGFFRFLIASCLFGLLLLLVPRLKTGGYNKDSFRFFLLLGLTGVFGYGVFFLIGMNFTTSAQGSIIAGFNPVTVSLIAHLIHNERLREKWQYLGFLVSFTGVIFVVGVQALIDFQLDYFLGNLIILCAMFLWGLYSSIGKSAMKTMNSVEATAGGVFVGMILFGMGALVEGFWSLPAMSNSMFWLNVLYLGAAVTFIGFLFYFDGIRNIGATNAAVFINFVPVFGVLLSALILQEEIYWTFLIGLLLVVLGVTIINYPVKRKIETRTAKMLDSKES